MQLYEDKPARAALPFTAVALLGALTLLFPPYNEDAGNLLIAVACGLLVAGMAVAVSVLPRTHWIVATPPLLFFPVIALARDATGGGASGLAPLVLLPVLWIVLYGSRVQLFLSAAATALVFIGPLVLVGDPKYDASDWRRGVIWSLVVLIVCPTVQRAVEHLRSSVDEEQRLTAQLAAVLRAATEHAIIATDMAGRITLFSQGAERMLGYPAAEVLGIASPVLFHDTKELSERAGELGMEPGFDVLVQDVSAHGATGQAWTYSRRDGSTLRIRLTVTRLMEHGNQTGWISIARDVTEMELAQHQLTTAERRWRTLLDHLPDTAVLVIGPDLEYRVAMGAGLVRLNWTEIQGKTLFESSNATNIALMEPIYRAALRGVVGSGELRATTTDAVTEFAVVPLPEHEGDAEALLVLRDVSEERRREMDLRVARDRFERLFEEAPHATMLIDGSGTITRVNPAYCALVGQVPDDVVGRQVQTLAAFTAGDEPSRVAELLSGELHRVTLERTMRLGEPDELNLAITAVALPGTIGEDRSILVTLVDISHHRRFQEQLAHLAEHDPLTGLANRRKFDSELNSHLERCRRYGAQGALLMLDLDNFKQINDTLGHGAGDEIIVAVAALLSRRMRTADVVARLGGDEFAVLLPNADREAAETVARDVVRLIGDQLGRLVVTRKTGVTASVGVVIVADTQMDFAEVMIAADLTMYEAKDAGGARFVLHAAA
jgi:diguanylate cyclase (GGDEF)-like protein/PAS domain S-box-containing protein